MYVVLEKSSLRHLRWRFLLHLKLEKHADSKRTKILLNGRTMRSSHEHELLQTGNTHTLHESML